MEGGDRRGRGRRGEESEGEGRSRSTLREKGGAWERGRRIDGRGK